MTSLRHIMKAGTYTQEQLAADVTDDVATYRSIQKSSAASGQHGHAARMGKAVDEHLDELNEVNNGTWKPRHG
ncbi:hypothetical protein [Streptomyces sp. NPDC101249]|uniref:hypothetical protein n=1 Tax=Streptomyces sp. NPDC101249 TaxID=3366140 RepID=UPI003816D172